MNTWRMLRAVLLLPWTALKTFVIGFAGILWAFGVGSRRLLLSVRAWLLFLLLVIATLIAYYIVSDRYTPFTTDAYVQAYVIQMAPRVEGPVVGVYVKENQSVKKNDLLYEIDPRLFQHRVDYLEAKLVAARYQIKQMEAELVAARHEDARLMAEEAYAKVVHGQEEEIFRGDATTVRKYDEATQKHKAAQAATKRSLELTRKAELALEARIGEEHAQVAQVKAQLAEAQVNLGYCRVHSPCDGIITNLQLRQGAYAHIGQAVLAVIDTGQWLIIANFREKGLQHMRPGQSALVAFRGEPGRLWPARVLWIGSGVSQGQGVPSGLLPDVKDQTSWIPAEQRFQVRLALEDPAALPLRVGMTGSVSVYTEADDWLNPITEAVHRLIAWIYYL